MFPIARHVKGVPIKRVYACWDATICLLQKPIVVTAHCYTASERVLWASLHDFSTRACLARIEQHSIGRLDSVSDACSAEEALHVARRVCKPNTVFKLMAERFGPADMMRVCTGQVL